MYILSELGLGSEEKRNSKLGCPYILDWTVPLYSLFWDTEEEYIKCKVEA